ncbi:unnamed protein product [Fusarium venenatum]|uniref:Clr5 domain-containing protein n=1 Tax=Fusarium venenatum TaxID=56646 RepID=A0A2L2SN86_9HYPO|nr:uncharacterized protein FVRRES_11595 [Fusarium venenatum]CEI38904.1 unnamed protein product [Fusarium venenatum]
MSTDRAPRIPNDQWESHKGIIKALYLDQNKTIKEIEKFMSDNCQFHATEKQYVRKVTVNWKLRKNATKEEWEQASALVLKRKAEGKATELTIHGKIIPDKKRKKETKRYAPKNLFVARTPSAANRDITYFTVPWFNLQSQLTGLGSLLRSFGNRSVLDLDPDITLSNVLTLVDEQIPFNHSHQKELQNQQTPVSGSWPRLFLSLVFLSSNNRLNEDVLVEFLKLAISCGFLRDLKQALSMEGPTMRMFSVALLSAALEVTGEEGLQLIRYLLQQGVNPNSVYSSRTPLWRAVYSKNKAAVRLLLEYDANLLASFPSLKLHSSCHMDCYDGESLAKALIGMRHQILWGTNPNRSISLPTPIFLAIQAGDELRVRRLLEAGADPNIFDTEHLSLLHVSIECKSSVMIDLLVKFGADPDLFCRTETMEALMLAHPEVFDFNRHHIHSIVTPLQRAAEKGKLNVARQLLQAGANPDGTAILDIPITRGKRYNELNFSLTPLQIASRGKKCEIVEMLLKARAGADTRRVLQSTALQYACSLDCGEPNKMKIVKLLLERGADVNASPGQENGKSCLEAAAGVGDIALIKTLLRKGAVCSNPHSFLKLAIRSGSKELVNFLLDYFSRAGESAVNVTHNWSEYLKIAAKSGNVQLLYMILELCVDRGTGIYEKHVIDAMEAAVDCCDSTMLDLLFMPGINPDADGRACRILSKAIQVWKNDEADSCFDLLMAKFMAWGFDLDKPLPGDATPFCTAIWLHNWRATQSLIVSGVDVDKPSLRYVGSSDGPGDGMRNDILEPPLFQAIRNHAEDEKVCLANLLITNGANVDNLVNEYRTALLLALKSQKYEVAEILLGHGANPNAEDPETGMDAFDFIFQNHRWPPFSTFKSLVDHGLRVKAGSNGGILIRFIAETSGGASIYDFDRWDALVPVASLLLDAGAEVNARPTEKYPMTALQYAVEANHKELITILLAAGANIHAPAFWKEGKTTLQAACYGGNLELVQSLVAQGLDINAQSASHYGATALQFAVMQGHFKIVIFLLENGALINAPAALFEGRTALQGASEHGILDMIYLLLENDQDDGLEERCQDAAKFAEAQSRFEIAQLLREYKKV